MTARPVGVEGAAVVGVGAGAGSALLLVTVGGPRDGAGTRRAPEGELHRGAALGRDDTHFGGPAELRQGRRGVSFAPGNQSRDSLFSPMTGL
jgi:hypothetical protein